LQKKMRMAIVAVLATGSLLGAACGDDDDTTTDDTTTDAEDTGGGEETDDGGEDTGGEDTDGGETEGAIAVTAVDYAFEGIPDTVESGATFTLTNEGEELHEMVAFLIPEGEDRSIEELVQLEDEELGEVFGGEPTPEFVLMAEPGDEGTVVFPEGAEATVTEAGRYGVVCFIPVGMTEMPSGEQEGPPEGDGPPHAMEGMVAEFTVE
jgi:plastocyanin